jgi:Skp family chaperone for outer membrane proteins
MKFVGPRAPMLAVLVAVLACAAPAARAQGQQGQPTRVAVADPARIFNDMQETKDLKSRLEAERNNLAAEEKNRRQKLQDLEAARNLLKPDSQQFADANKQLLQAAIEFETWGKLTQNDVQRNQKQQMRSLFDKITAAAGEVAKQKGYDVVIADQRPDLASIEQLNVNQLRDLINQRNVLYANPTIDITNDVIAALDAQHKAAGGGTGAAPAPAPTTPPPAPGKQ